MKMCRIETARAAHIGEIARDMRESDVREVWALGRQSPKEALETSLSGSALAWTCFTGGKAVCMWGVGRRSILSDTGVPWMLCTKDVSLVRRDIARMSRHFVGRMHSLFSRLENLVHADNSASIRWLMWCGFTVGRDAVRINGENFYNFLRVV